MQATLGACRLQRLLAGRGGRAGGGGGGGGDCGAGEVQPVLLLSG